MTVAAIYARVSSTRQKEEGTIASQTAALRAHAAAMSVEVPPEWIFEDEGYSGATLTRPALERLRDLAAEVEIPLVLCYAPDRLARRYAYQALLIEEFARAGTEVRFVKGPKGETPEDELLVQFQGMIAEYERAQITERTRRGKLHRARSGSVSVLSGAPFGYRYLRKTEHAEARYEIVEREAAIVREAFRRFVEEQESILGLARWLREQGIRTPRGKTFWTRGALGRMLRNPAYCGRAAFGKSQSGDEPTKGNRVRRQQGGRVSYPAVRRRSRDQWIEIPVPPIVSEEIFAQTARRLEDNKRFAARRTKAPSLLQGLAVCESCGYSYIRAASNSGARRLYYYRCIGSDNFRFEHGRVCNSRMVRQDYLDALVWEHVTALLTQPQLIRTEIDRRLKQLQSTNPVTAQTSHLEMELSRTTRAKNRLLEAYQEELLSLDELRARMPELKKRESTLRAQLQSLDAQEVDRELYLALAENLEGFLARLHDAAESTTDKDRQRIVRLLVKEVLIGSDRILIRHSIPVGGTSPRSFRLCRRGLRSQPWRQATQASASGWLRLTSPQPASRRLRGRWNLGSGLAGGIPPRSSTFLDSMRGRRAVTRDDRVQPGRPFRGSVPHIVGVLLLALALGPGLRAAHAFSHARAPASATCNLCMVGAQPAHVASALPGFVAPEAIHLDLALAPEVPDVERIQWTHLSRAPPARTLSSVVG